MIKKNWVDIVKFIKTAPIDFNDLPCLFVRGHTLADIAILTKEKDIVIDYVVTMMDAQKKAAEVYALHDPNSDLLISIKKEPFIIGNITTNKFNRNWLTYEPDAIYTGDPIFISKSNKLYKCSNTSGIYNKIYATEDVSFLIEGGPITDITVEHFILDLYYYTESRSVSDYNERNLNFKPSNIVKVDPTHTSILRKMAGDKHTTTLIKLSELVQRSVPTVTTPTEVLIDSDIKLPITKILVLPNAEMEVYYAIKDANEFDRQQLVDLFGHSNFKTIIY